MQDANFTALVDRIMAAGVMTDEDLLTLRRATGADFAISAYEADSLFTLNEKIQTPDEWDEYFVMVITTFLIDQTKPVGYITDINAAWLRARIEHDGVVETETELALLLSILKQAKNVTDSLEKFALDQVKEAVVNGRGQLSKRKGLTPGVIGEPEVEILRKVLYSVSSEGGMGISLVEAEALFELNKATSGAPNAKSWQRLFVQGISNYLLVAAAPEELPMNEALSRENWLADAPDYSGIVGKGALFSAGVRTLLTGFSTVKSQHFVDFLRLKDPLKAPDEHMKFANLDKAITKQAARLTQTEENWLLAEMHKDGRVDPNELALLEFLVRECDDVDSDRAENFTKAS